MDEMCLVCNKGGNMLLHYSVLKHLELTECLPIGSLQLCDASIVLLGTHVLQYFNALLWQIFFQTSCIGTLEPTEMKDAISATNVGRGFNV